MFEHNMSLVVCGLEDQIARRVPWAWHVGQSFSSDRLGVVAWQETQYKALPGPLFFCRFSCEATPRPLMLATEFQVYDSRREKLTYLNPSAFRALISSSRRTSAT
jgi:hypothetical protein